MKLTTQQIEKIEHYLLDWGLEYKDFYDEVLDHFISKIEIYLDDETDFDSAFVLTKRDFSGKKFKDNYGLKAFEAEFEYGLQQRVKRDIRTRMKNQFSTWRILVWGFVAWLFYKYSLEQNDNYLVVILTLILFFQLYVMYKTIDWNKNLLNSRWLLPKEELSIHNRKTQYLYDKTRSKVLIKNTVLFVPFFIMSLNLANYTLPIIRWASIIGIALLFSVSWAYFEFQLSEKSV
jgi:hypothetical protein